MSDSSNNDIIIGSDEEHMKALWEGQSNVLVAVRVRPILKHDVIKKSCVRVLDSKVVIIVDPALDSKDILRANRSREKQYAFDVAFDQSSGQEYVYQKTTKFLLHGVLDGYNATVFAYGQTGSGKTHTMIGSPSDPGIMVRVMEDLFYYSSSQGEQQRVNYKVTVSFLEVYNENIRDLLGDVEEYLDLREDPIKGPVVAGITEVEAKSSQEIMNLLHQGNARRSQAATAANDVSSRSHAVLQVVVENIDKAPGIVANIKVGKLSLVDLAGSERAANTKNVGVRLVEGANINRSLLALGNCINALGEKGNKGNFVPYRDSKLTRLLKDSLGGNCRTIMIANISSAESSFEETLNTLKYANRAKNIKTNVQRNVLNVNYHISEYVQLITNLRGEIKMLKDQLVVNEAAGSAPRILHQESNIVIMGGREGEEEDYSSKVYQSPARDPPVTAGSTSPTQTSQSQHRNPATPLQSLRESMKSVGEGRTLVTQMRDQIVENFQEKMQLRRSLIELEDQNVQNSIEISKRQLLVVHWSESQGYSPLKIKGKLTENRSDFSVEVIANAPDDIKRAWQECEQLRKAVLKNNAMKKNISKRLRHNEREANTLRDEMSHKVTGEDRRELMELQYQVGRLELENMELEQHRIVHESILKGKDLTIQKLQLQLAVRDKVIQRQQKILTDHNLDDKVGYPQMALLEQTLMSDVDLSSSLVPPSPPRSLSELTGQGNPPGAIPQGNTINRQRLRDVSNEAASSKPPHTEAFMVNEDDEAIEYPTEMTKKNRFVSPPVINDWDSETQNELVDEVNLAIMSDGKSPRGNGSDPIRKFRLKNHRKKNRVSDINMPSNIQGIASMPPSSVAPTNFGIQGNGLRGQGVRGGRMYRATSDDVDEAPSAPPNLGSYSARHQNRPQAASSAHHPGASAKKSSERLDPLNIPAIIGNGGSSIDLADDDDEVGNSSARSENSSTSVPFPSTKLVARKPHDFSSLQKDWSISPSNAAENYDDDFEESTDMIYVGASENASRLANKKPSGVSGALAPISEENKQNQRIINRGGLLQKAPSIPLSSGITVGSLASNIVPTTAVGAGLELAPVGGFNRPQRKSYGLRSNKINQHREGVPVANVSGIGGMAPVVSRLRQLPIISKASEN